ncbi:MAG: hypothetical protein QMD14_05045 [Candidatus Aenigmarchaeota archaeon]|nr:hypothetical protein [Candidatus Aenigmarchaeota archaeon]
MEIKVLEEKENLFFKRKELKVEIGHAGLPTPKKDEVITELAKKYSVDPTQVTIDYILTKSGTTSSLVKAKILEEKPKEEKLEKKEEKSEEVKGEKAETQTSESK